MNRPTFWQSITLILLGAGFLVLASLVPKTAPALTPLGGLLLLVADVRNIFRGPDAPTPPAPPPAAILLLVGLALGLLSGCGESPPVVADDAGVVHQAILHPLPLHTCVAPRFSTLHEARCRGWEACAACTLTSIAYPGQQSMAACVSAAGSLCVATCAECYWPFTWVQP